MVLLISKFERAGCAATRCDISDWVVGTLELRKAANRLSGRRSIALSRSAVHVLQTKALSAKWFEGFYLRHSQVEQMEENSRPYSAQRAFATTPENRDRLFKCRMQALRETGILDPATGVVDITRIFNSDECPNPIDGSDKGNNKHKVHGGLNMTNSLSHRAITKSRCAQGRAGAPSAASPGRRAS